jgi:hypothetical protein
MIKYDYMYSYSSTFLIVYISVGIVVIVQNFMYTFLILQHFNIFQMLSHVYKKNIIHTTYCLLTPWRCRPCRSLAASHFYVRFRDNKFVQGGAVSPTPNPQPGGPGYLS